MDLVASFPHLSAAEFHTACTTLVDSFNLLQAASHKEHWTACTLDSHESLLRINKEFPVPYPSESHVQDNEDAGLEEDDEEALDHKDVNTPLIHYDILLSPTYSVPVLYFHISDTLHRYPPTMDTLYKHIITQEYIDQTKDVGVLGGITITDHPILNRPVFFIHPCRTAEVMEASMGGKPATSLGYLLMWIGAMGKSVGLDIPLQLILQAKR
ncbi:uncharacterized protein N0V89_012263 [Didymosphaeria variabile]|uniref:Ubiquitin-like-conjugating enzyme ATG10 n=1 Tax=Didymosphaeria variabile TaxID=1932322 RepID=A0A9W9C5Y9_9PLEO|nr:uncharacterized protein N0V89_012263 [Didymosphaeria variabile]KAJ4344520.1 hypothetical protein N0V89_012263 [Didymosphaeria variabile]